MGIWRLSPRYVIIELRCVFPLEESEDAARSRFLAGRLTSSPNSYGDVKATCSVFYVKKKIRTIACGF
jgi:hypothetical protein